MTELELKEYELNGALEDEEDALNNFAEYSGNTYVHVAIMDIADRYVPIYYTHLWKEAEDIEEYINEAMSQGLCEGVDDIIKVLQTGFYQYYTSALYANLDELVYNMIAEKVNTVIGTLSEEHRNNIDFEALGAALEEYTKDFDNNNDFYAIDTKADELIKQFVAVAEC